MPSTPTPALSAAPAAVVAHGDAAVRDGVAPLATHLGLVVCDECDAVYTRRLLAPGTVARCGRCGALLGRGHRLGTQGQLALAMAALVVFLIANVADIVTLELRGVAVEVTLHEAIAHTWRSGERLVAVLAAATAFAFPLGMIALRL